VAEIKEGDTEMTYIPEKMPDTPFMKVNTGYRNYLFYIRTCWIHPL
jgi:hypothetical protein